jgi:hypothetical protein
LFEVGREERPEQFKDWMIHAASKACQEASVAFRFVARALAW